MPNPEWGLLIGDIAHNARSALDHLVWQLVILSGNRPTRDNQFPIFQVEKDYWEIPKDHSLSNRDRMLGGVSEEYRAIIDGIQPYTVAADGEDPSANFLARLSWLNNVDKHRLVHAAFVASQPFSEGSFTAVGSPPGVGISITTTTGPMDDGAEIMRFKPDQPMLQVHVHGDLRLAIGIGDGRLDVGGLNIIVNFVDLYIWSFRLLFEGRPYREPRTSPRPRPVSKRAI
jgi:hypothetical protein